MRRTIQYLSVAILTFAIGAGLYLTLSHRPHAQPKREPPVAFVPDGMNKGARCLEDTAYVWERQEDVESGVVNPFCAGAQMRLLKAASDGDAEGVREALSQGANPNSNGWTEERFYYEMQNPLVQAAWGGHAEVVKLLLDNGAKVDQEYCCCMSCRTPLSAAVEGGHAETVKVLIGYGADVDYRDRYSPEWTVLRAAERKGNQEIIKLLREAQR